MPPKKDWRESPSDAENTALRYSDIAIGYLSRNDRYRADYRLALRRVQRGIISPDDATAALVRRWGISFHADPSVAFDPKMAVARPDLSPASVVLAPAIGHWSGAESQQEDAGRYPRPHKNRRPPSFHSRQRRRRRASLGIRFARPAAGLNPADGGQPFHAPCVR